MENKQITIEESEDLHTGKRIIVIGGGFAGINLVKSLSTLTDFQIILVDQNNYNFFPPLIYQVATGFLEPSSISFPFRKLLNSYENVSFFLGELKGIISSENKILLSTGELSYDYLVFATGTNTNYFGMNNIHKNAIPMKTLEDALHLRNIYLQQLEKASRTESASERTDFLSIVIAGGGPTGVEIAGMLAEMKQRILPNEYPELKEVLQNQKIYLVDGANSLLSPMSGKSQKYTYDSLIKMGVKIKLNAQVNDFDGKLVTFKDGGSIATETLLWTAGVTGYVFPGIPEDCYGRGNRLLVDQYHRVKGFTNIMAIGDISLLTSDKKYPNGHPQVAQVAIQQGKSLAVNLARILDRQAPISFTYKDKGSMAIIGKNKAVVDLNEKTHYSGFLAWLMWVLVHLVSLLTYRNRLRTFYNWFIAYLTHDQSLRFIIRPTKKEL